MRVTACVRAPRRPSTRGPIRTDGRRMHPTTPRSLSRKPAWSTRQRTRDDPVFSSAVLEASLFVAVLSFAPHTTSHGRKARVVSAAMQARPSCHVTSVSSHERVVVCPAVATAAADSRVSPDRRSVIAVPATLGGGFVAMAKTVQRDVVKRAGMGYGLECLQNSKPHRWRSAPDAKQMVMPGLDLPQALALLMVASHVPHLLPRTAAAALRPHFDAAHVDLWTASLHAEGLAAAGAASRRDVDAAEIGLQAERRRPVPAIRHAAGDDLQERSFEGRAPSPHAARAGARAEAVGTRNPRGGSAAPPENSDERSFAAKTTGTPALDDEHGLVSAPGRRRRHEPAQTRRRACFAYINVTQGGSPRAAFWVPYSSSSLGAASRTL
jgi:hypothetical protein